MAELQTEAPKRDATIREAKSQRPNLREAKPQRPNLREAIIIEHQT